VDSNLAGSEEQEDEDTLDKDEFVVEKLIGICYGGSGRKNDIYFKVLKRYLFMYT
jgi:DNA (cytosine-5)-methyltransferase 1